jgi:hypothetical protein
MKRTWRGHIVVSRMHLEGLSRCAIGGRGGINCRVDESSRGFENDQNFRRGIDIEVEFVRPLM